MGAFTGVLVLFLLSTCTAYNTKIITSTDRLEQYSFFPFQTKRLEFSVKASREISIALTNRYDLKEAYYQIIFGGWNNTKSIILKDTQEFNQGQTFEATIDSDRFQKYWIVLEHKKGEIVIGKEDQTLLTWKDPNYVRMGIFGISTGRRVHGVWLFDYEIDCC